MNGSHREANERVIRKLYFNDPRYMDVVINKFWNGFKHWKQKSVKYGVDIWRWILPEVVRGGSHIWNERYSSLYYPEVEHVGCRTIYKITGIGPGERAWGDVNISRQASACASVEKKLRSRLSCTQLRASMR